MRQLGNAAPVTLGEKVLRSVQDALGNSALRTPPLNIMFALSRFDLPIAVTEQLVAQLDK